MRDYLDTKFKIDRSFLTGSYARWTKTKPLKDVDIFFVLKSSEDHYRSKAPSVVLTDFHGALVEKYGDKAEEAEPLDQRRLWRQRRCRRQHRLPRHQR